LTNFCRARESLSQDGPADLKKRVNQVKKGIRELYLKMMKGHKKAKEPV